MILSILNNLEIVPMNLLRFHEEHDPCRLQRIVADIKESKHLNNPPMATICNDGTYLILDGLHRAKALGELEMNKLIIQRVDLNHPKLKILSWTHVIPDHIDIISDENFPKEVPMFTLYRSNQVKTYLGPKCLQQRLAIMHNISSAYLKEEEIERLPESPDFLDPGKQYITFQPFTLEEFNELKDHHYITPPGLTRLLIPDRLLNLKFPLSLFNQEDKSDFHQQISLYKNRLRKYTEEVYILE